MQIASQISKINRILQDQARFMSFEQLGKTLAYNSYIPRLNKEFFSKAPIEALYKRADSEILQSSIDAPIVWLEVDIDALSDDFLGTLEVFSQLRRYSNTLSVYDGIVIDKYQILLAAVFGIDAMVLYANFLSQKELRDLLVFSNTLGISLFVECTSVEDVKKAIFSGAEMIYIKSFEKFTKLLGYIPNGKILATSDICESIENVYGLDLLVRKSQ